MYEEISDKEIRLQYWGSLEDHRDARGQTIEQFAEFLGITWMMYNHVLCRDPQATDGMRLHIAERLGVQVSTVEELVPNYMLKLWEKHRLDYEIEYYSVYAEEVEVGARMAGLIE